MYYYVTKIYNFVTVPKRSNLIAVLIIAMGAMPCECEWTSKIIKVAEQTAEVTHNHLEGIKGAITVAATIYLARTIKNKDYIRLYVSSNFGYNIYRCCDDIRPTYEFDESCQGTVPEAIIAFLDSNSFEEAIRLAVSLGGDSDTLACITGGIAEVYYGIPDNIRQRGLEYLPSEMRSIIAILYRYR